jgi:CelD/BcsL family acetyltransferase involved in cellulose biosynthesis
VLQTPRMSTTGRQPGWADVEEARELAPLRDEWSALAERTGAGIFGTCEWAEAWWDAYGRHGRLAVFTCRTETGALGAILPLYVRRRGGVTIARFIGHGPGDELGPVTAAADRVRTAAALAEVVAQLGPDVLVAELLPGGQGWPERMGRRPWRHESSPSLAVPDGGWDAYLAGRSANLRQQIGRRTRALDRRGTVLFRRADEGSLEQDMDTLFRLHRARWGSARTDFEDTPFHREIARRALARGWLRLWTLELDGTPVASWHGFRVGGVTSYYQAGRDPAFDGDAVGFVLLAHTIRHAIDEGSRHYRFGRGDEPFKLRFADADHGLETVVVPRTGRGRAALAVARALRPLRRLRRRASGL